MKDPRHTRQIALREVGAEGQLALAKARVVSAGQASGVEAEYLRRAGVGVVECSACEPVPFAHAHLFRHHAPRELAASSWRALLTLREVLGIR